MEPCVGLAQNRAREELAVRASEDDAQVFPVLLRNEAGERQRRDGRQADRTVAMPLDRMFRPTPLSTATTLQFVADPTPLAACYDNHGTLLWRGAGALLMIVFVRSFGMDEPVLALGAVHVGDRRP